MSHLAIDGPARLEGSFHPPGDKSISHRCLLLGALATGVSRVSGWLRSADVAASRRLVEALGVEVVELGADVLEIRPPTTFGEPGDVIDCANSGTTARLGLGLLSGLPLTATLGGDASLRARPMRRVVDPLTHLGARFLGREGGNLLPVTVSGGGLEGRQLELTVASGQVKGALLLAGLAAEGELVLAGRLEGRDHTERMLRATGVELRERGGRLHLRGPQRPGALCGKIPGDPSSAAFFLTAAAMLPGSDVVASGVGLNPGRTGFLEILAAMGARVEVEPEEESLGEPVGSIRIQGGPLRGIRWDPSWVVRAIDEVPILAVAACLAEGETVITEAAELRVKESDRLATIARELGNLGARLEERPDGLVIRGPQRFTPGRVEGHGDHRIVMALAVAALAAGGRSVIEGTEAVEISYPGFFQDLADLRR